MKIQEMIEQLARDFANAEADAQRLTEAAELADMRMWRAQRRVKNIERAINALCDECPQEET